MDAAANRSAMVIFAVKILASRMFLVFRNMYRMPNQFINTLILLRENRHNKNAQQLLPTCWFAPVSWLNNVVFPQF